MPDQSFWIQLGFGGALSRHGCCAGGGGTKQRGQNKMKDSSEATAARQAPEQTEEEEFVSRKLIRPSLSAPPPRTEPRAGGRERPERADRMPANRPRRTLPPDQ